MSMRKLVGQNIDYYQYVVNINNDGIKEHKWKNCAEIKQRFFVLPNGLPISAKYHIYFIFQKIENIFAGTDVF